MSYEVKLEHFEGPLDLLLHLIQKNEVDIYDIPIAQITDQYLEQLMQMRQLNLEVAGEFLLMAATLIYIKSRMLLPQIPESEEEAPAEDPRQELVERLIEYRRYKQAASLLEREEDRFQQQFTSHPEPAGADPSSLDPEIGLFELLSAFYDLLKKTEGELPWAIDREELDIHQSMVQILDQMGQNRSLTLTALLGGVRSRLRMIVAFLALLELIRQGMVKVRQERHLGDVWIYRTG
jgi:segregation and condensation protein A